MIVMLNHSFIYNVAYIKSYYTKELFNEANKVVAEYQETLKNQKEAYKNEVKKLNTYRVIQPRLKDQKSDKKDSLIELKFDGEISQDCKNKAIELYSLVSDNIKDAIRNKGYIIIVSSNPWWTDGHAGTFYPFNFNLEQGNVIAIYAKSVKNVDMAVLHEIGHFIDNYCGERDNCEESELFSYQAVTTSDEWNIIYNKEKDISQFPSWATDCCEDFFAEVYWRSLTETDWCKENIPLSYEFVTNYANSV